MHRIKVTFLYGLTGPELYCLDLDTTAGPIRLLPVLMTSLALILGSLPVALGLGAGAASGSRWRWW